jgi:hypothetical protein
LKQGIHLGGDGVKVNYARLKALLSAEGKQLPGQSCRAETGVVNMAKLGTDFVADFGLRDQKLAVTRDYRENVVEVVGDPAGKLPNCLYFLGLSKALLKLAMFGDILDSSVDMDDRIGGIPECSAALANIQL